MPGALYGRDGERAELRRAFDAMVAGRGRLVLIGGEAGIGKTALVEDLARNAAAHGALVFTGHSYDVLELSPYTPWAEILQQYSPLENLPEIPEQLRPGVDVSDARSQHTLFEKGRDLFGAIARLRPLVLVLEDAHWADQASLEALRYLARWLAGQPVLFIVTYRDDETQRERPLFRLLPDLIRTLQPLRLELRQLAEHALHQLVEARYGLSGSDRERLVTFLAGYSEGNPFYALEVLRSLEIDQTLLFAGGAWRLGDIAGFRMPSLLRQIMTDRLADQDAQARGWLEIAAVIGMEVSFELWTTVCQADYDQLADAFARARDLALVREVLGRASFEFSHALLREALYERMPPPQRQAWHARIGDALTAESRPPANLVAHHYRMAGDSRAAEWLIRAGEEAQAGYAWQAAIERYYEALAALSAGPDRITDEGWLHFRIGALARYGPPAESLPALERAERLGLAAGDAVLVAYSRFKQGIIKSFNAQTDQPLDELRQAVMDIGRLTPADFANAGDLRTSLAGDPLVSEAHETTANLGLGTLALRFASAGRHAEAEAAALELLDSFDEPPGIDDPGLDPYADAYTALGFVYTVRCRPYEARDALHRARDAYRRADDRRDEALGYFAELTMVVNTFEHHRLDERRALAEQAAAAMQRAQGAFPSELPPELFSFENFWLEGEWDKAVTYAQPAQWNMGPDIILAEIALCRGDEEEVRRFVRKALPDGPRSAPGRPSFLVRFNLILIAARQCLASADLEEARAWIECFAHWIEWSGMTFGQADLALLWAEYHTLRVDLESAREEAQRALELASAPPQALVLLPAHRLLAALDRDAGDFERAGRHIEHALALARKGSMPYEEALGWLAQAELLIAIEDNDTAVTKLNAAADVFHRLQAAPALQQVTALASRISMHASEVSYPGGLSAREVEVLRLVAEGLTDAEVAERLFISRRTVSQHLRSIYSKLGIGSRVSAARFAMEQGLV